MARGLFLLFILIVFIPGLAVSGGLTSTERRRIESDATDSLKTIVDFWKNGKWEDLYDYGHRKSQTSISKESFVNRMKNKSYEWASSWETIKDIEAEVESHKLVYVKAKVGYKRKGGGDTKFLTETYRMIFEEERWRIDLSKILRSPF